jgi:phage-related minor tail protein
MRDRLQKVGEGMTSIGSKMSTFLTAPLVGVGVYGVKAFSDLNEAVNASNVVFGQASGKIMDFGKTAAESVGLSQRAFLQASVPIGSALQNVGLSASDAGDMTIKLTQRAADMASVFNTDVGTALGAIQAGLRGEIDPLERFGVGLSETSIKAYAMANGIGTVGTELTMEEKTLARVGLLMEQTNRVQDDFKNTSDGLANSTRIARAELENNAAVLGEKLAPIASKVITLVNDLMDRYNSLSPSVQDNILKVAGFVAILGPLLVILGTVTTSVIALIPIVSALGTAILFVAGTPITALILALGAMLLAVAKAMKEVGGAKEFFRQTWDGIKIIFSEAINSIVGYFQPLINKVNEVINKVANLKNSISGAVGGAVGKIVGPVFRAFGGSVNPNQPYIVGERGPELFTPNSYGQITRNSQIGAGGSGVTVNVYGDVSGESLVNTVKQAIMRDIKLNAQI